jgi:hypothetical protein
MNDIEHFRDDIKKFSHDETAVIDHLYSVLSATETILEGALDEMKKRLKEKPQESGMKYVRKSNIIEAIQWTGKNLKEVIDLIGLHPSAKKWTWKEYEKVVQTDGLKIFREFGYSEFVSIGDWITKNSIGIVYSYGDDYFKETYQSIEEKKSE